MFSSNYLSQRNSQSCYENTLRPSLSDYNISSNNEQISQNNIFTQNPLIISQHSNMSNNSMRMQGTQQSLGLGSNNYINYKQFENIMIENVKSFPEQVSNYLTSSRGDISLRLLMNSIYSASLVTSQNFDKINNTFCAKLTSSNICVEKFLELCAKMNYLLNVIDNDLVNQFSLLTSFHGYDESIQNEEKDNIETIERVINECNELLFEKIIKPNQNSMNFNEEINQNCIELKNILFEEMNILYQNLNKLIKLRKEKNDHQNGYQQILDGVAEVIASLKDKFIFSNNKDMNNENVHVCEENKENNINRNKEADNKEINNSDVTDEVKIQKRLATIKIISEMNKRYKRKKKKYFK
jgi:hypothetical protein